MNKKESEKEIDFVKWFSEINKTSGNVAGGKGANLGEIYNLKLPVPQGFVVTAQAYDYFIEKAGIKQEIFQALEKIDYEDTQQLEDSAKKIRGLILDSKIPKEMEEEIIESYENLSISKSQAQGPVRNILNASSEPVFVAVRSSATAEDLEGASFAGQQDSFVNIKGNQELLEHIKKCFSSLFTARATYYRDKKGFKHEDVSLAVVVQKMVDSDKSGVIFSKDPSQKSENIIVEAVFGLGEGIVSGRISPDTYLISPEIKILDKKIADKKIAITRNSAGEKITIKLKEEKSKSQVLTDYEIKKLTEYALKLEAHYNKPQDIEFGIENENIYLLQTRPITTMATRYEKAADVQGEVVLTGLPASPGIAYGKIKIINKMEDLPKIKKGDILVTKMTNPDMVVSMQKSAAIVTDEGGITSHAAIVSREMGIPAVVGTQEATRKLKEEEIITVDGFSGKIYKGKVSEKVQKEVLPVIETKTKIKVIVDLPSFAERASHSKVKEVGLTRIEGIISESGKHPFYFLQNDKIKDYEDIIFKGIEGIAKYFEEVWVRTSDLRSDEYSNLEGAPKEKEQNPMLGMHGIRFGLKKPSILKAELNALKRVSKEGKRIGLLLPQIISVEEVMEVKEILKEIEFLDAKIGVMIETPASVQIIRELCEEGIDFISFGTNDLTQYTLAIDRNNEEVQYIYNEMHPAMLHQLEYVIKVCKEFGVESSICGQAGSKKEMADVLFNFGIDSISVNADAAHEISKFIAELEGKSEKEVEEIEEQIQEIKEKESPGENEESSGNIQEEDVEKPIEEIDNKENNLEQEKELIKKSEEEPINEIEKEIKYNQQENEKIKQEEIKDNNSIEENSEEEHKEKEKPKEEVLDIF